MTNIVKAYRRRSVEAVKEGEKAVQKGDFYRAEALRREAVAYELQAQRVEREQRIRKQGTLYNPRQPIPYHVRRAERTR
jgi:hypothetical protein